MNKHKLQPTGYGGFKSKVIVQVKANYADAFELINGAPPRDKTPNFSNFEIELISKKYFDDETIVDELTYIHCGKLPLDAWKVLWDKSIY